MYQQIAANKAKSVFTIIFFVLFIGVVGFFIGLLFDYRYGIGSYFSIIILVIAFVIALIASFTSYYYSDKIVLQISKAHPIDMETDIRVNYTVEGLSIAAGIPMPRIYIIEENGMNAFATGRNPQNGVIVLTRGIISNLNDEELKGVISHELSHIKNYDILLGTVVVIFVGMLSIASNIILRSFLFGGGRRRSNDRSGGGGILALVMLVIGLVLIILSPIIGSMIRMAISRNREYLADSSGALISRYPAGLANALRKISVYSGVESASSATSHMFIADPLTKKNKPLLANLFSTHPPIEERIRRLDEMSLGVGINK
ncbi:MAG: M48 family metalloprotease [Actinobacteria bacterium]|jgi:heat shock protein HtpX|nr:M48 family metalloprotease [Actinomycetota bacterium]